MELDIVSPAGSGGKLTVADGAFGLAFNEDLVHQAVVAYQAGGRQGTRAQKTRAEVSGGGKKPWRQKGTGRARAGSIRSPLWRTGGVSFAARPQDHSQKLNRKMYRGALRSILSELVRQDRLLVVESFALEAPKTKALLKALSAYALTDVLIVTAEPEENLYLAARNLHRVEVCEPLGINPVSLIKFEKVLVTVPALKKIEEMLV